MEYCGDELLLILLKENFCQGKPISETPKSLGELLHLEITWKHVRAWSVLDSVKRKKVLTYLLVLDGDVDNECHNLGEIWVCFLILCS